MAYHIMTVPYNSRTQHYVYYMIQSIMSQTSTDKWKSFIIPYQPLNWDGEEFLFDEIQKAHPNVQLNRLDENPGSHRVYKGIHTHAKVWKKCSSHLADDDFLLFIECDVFCKSANNFLDHIERYNNNFISQAGKGSKSADHEIFWSTGSFKMFRKTLFDSVMNRIIEYPNEQDFRTKVLNNRYPEEINLVMDRAIDIIIDINHPYEKLLATNIVTDVYWPRPNQFSKLGPMFNQTEVKNATSNIPFDFCHFSGPNKYFYHQVFRRLHPNIYAKMPDSLKR